MAVTLNYPSNLPNFKLGKQRQQKQTFRTSQPFNGPLFIEKITDESPVIWEVSVVCPTPGLARVFQAFLRQTANGEPFNKDIWTEEGFVPHEVRFIEMPLRPEQSGTSVWTYRGTIYATALTQNDALVNDDLIILYAEQSDIIDIAVNTFWAAS
jgi:hypothetical protein